ncbi:protein CHROMOSOME TRANSMISSION FIDELITY 7-like isoform X2 [Hevea brasiliensis]|uniref:protein CHROMOSOME TRANSMISSION FIDELITY 7-like isoform X2 n=1 Tax=Hevea brasiliensis TaxID=3981 RepID=UPI0025FA9CE8|nr:protein CHROMOSOME TRANSMISSION FIDELITY 7-like isoform X2 [Hevea brasiliensis]
MQSKISSFFKPSSSSSSSKSDQDLPSIFKDDDHELVLWEIAEHQFVNTYKRRAPQSNEGVEGNEGPGSDVLTTPISKDLCLKPESRSSGKVLNKKRSYAQFHLDLGQSDFNFRTCSACGVKYAPGEEEDEKNHKTFHRNYTHGVQYKGCRNERVVHMPCSELGRIVLVLGSDPPAQRNKVQEVVKMMEIELGGGWIFHKLCKVYLFISSQRVAGCLVAEPIKEAFKVLPCSVDKRSDATKKDSKSDSTTLRFGEIILQRETTKKAPTVNSLEVLDRKSNGAIVCEEKAVSAICGIRAIWVTPSNRRKRIAAQLLDAVRKSFCIGFTLQQSQIAFSPPTSAGKALAFSYTGTASFMVYKPNAVDS